MTWLILCIVAACAWAIGNFIDNYIADVIFKNKTPQALKAINGPFYLLIAGAIALIVGLEATEPLQIAMLMLSGALSSLASIPYYTALKHEEATGAAIYYQLIPVFYLVADWLIFQQEISGRQILAFLIIFAAPIVVIFSRKRAKTRRNEMTAGLLFVIYAIITVASGLFSTHFSDNIGFTTMFFWYLIGRGCCDLLLFIVNGSWRHRFKYIWRHKRKQFLISAITDQTFHTIAEFAYRSAMIIGVAALASVVANTAELIITFVLGIILSIIWPKFGREQIHRHIIIAHLLATILAVIGVIILQ